MIHSCVHVELGSCSILAQQWLPEHFPACTLRTSYAGPEAVMQHPHILLILTAHVCCQSKQAGNAQSQRLPVQQLSKGHGSGHVPQKFIQLKISNRKVIKPLAIVRFFLLKCFSELSVFQIRSVMLEARTNFLFSSQKNYITKLS